MSIQIYNSLSGEKEEFKPIEPWKIRMYACGITPQSSSHIGHAVSAIRFAFIRKYLEFSGYSVSYVENVTDIDDKIIVKSKELNRSVRDIAEENYNEYRSLLNQICVPLPTHTPKATQYVDKIIDYINVLIEKNYAYIADNGDVYFDVRKKEDYFKLSKRKHDQSISGTRVIVRENKRDLADFGLWKITDDGENFDSPWGRGRPGWHIECSTMANDLLGEVIDIHCGGLDLLFPHHENEIAQSEAHNGHEYVNYWIHSGLLTINGEKMSKSLNNFITLKDGLDTYGAELLVWSILRHNYRSSIDLTDKLFADNLNLILKFYNFFDRFPKIYEYQDFKHSDLNQDILSEFNKLMNDDFHTPKVIVLMQKYLEEASKKSNDEAEAIALTLFKLGRILGLFTSNESTEIKNQLLKYQSKRKNLKEELTLEKILTLIDEVRESRNKNDYAKADQIRNGLSNVGVQLNYENGGEYSWIFIL